MKTLLLSEIFPPMTGGSGRWFWEIYHRMPRDQFVIAAGCDPEDSKFDQTHDLDLVRVPLTMNDWGFCSPTGLRQYWRVLREVHRLVRRHEITRLHCGRCLPEGWIALAIKKLIGIPYSCYVHGEDANAKSVGADDGVLSSRQLRWMTRNVLHGAESIIANSRNSAQIATEQWNLDDDRVHLLHPGVDTRWFSPVARSAETRQRLGWDDRPVVLTAGRLQKRKGHDTVIRAIATIREAVPNVLFAIIGDGEEREPLERLIEQESQSDHVMFMGKVDDDVLRQAYQQADLFVLANRQIGTDIEGFGMVLLEAQACGTPVIAGASGGTAETMKQSETGYVVPCDKPDQLAELIVSQLLDCNRLQEMGTAAREWVTNSFDWEVLSQQAATMFGVSGFTESHQKAESQLDHLLAESVT